MLVDRLPNLRGHHAPGVQREGQLEADGTLSLIETLAAVRSAVGVDAIRIAMDSIAASDEVERREMSAARSAYVFSSNVRRQAAGDQRQILLQSHFHPPVLADRVGIGELERFDGSCQGV